MTCVGCRWAQWQRTRNGRRNPGRPGKCIFPESPVPVCEDQNRWRGAIWADIEHECPCHQEDAEGAYPELYAYIEAVTS